MKFGTVVKYDIGDGPREPRYLMAITEHKGICLNTPDPEFAEIWYEGQMLDWALDRFQFSAVTVVEESPDEVW